LAGGEEVDELVHGHALEVFESESAVGEFFDHDCEPHPVFFGDRCWDVMPPFKRYSLLYPRPFRSEHNG